MGIGFFGTPNSSAMMGAVSERQRAVASGILATNRNIGMSVGIALSTSLFTYLQKQYAGLGGENAIFVASYRPVIYVGIGLCLLGAVFCLFRGERAAKHSY
jgi:MFS family permease